jgi:hypothetical protein
VAVPVAGVEAVVVVLAAVAVVVEFEFELEVEAVVKSDIDDAMWAS